jgi:signal transduction histidine kinase
MEDVSPTQTPHISGPNPGVSISTARLLILDHDTQNGSLTAEFLKQQVSASTVVVTKTFSELRQLVHQQSFDVAIVSGAWSPSDIHQLPYELKSCDTEPSLIVITPLADSRVIADLYNGGCYRCIVQDDRWKEELGVAVRHLLRFRQLVEENIKIRTKLTEANMLLAERNRRLDEFSSTVAHDIRGPLGGITMKLEYLKDNHPGEIAGRFAEVLNRALDSSKRLTGVVQAMYEFAKLGKAANKMEPITLSTLVEEIVGDMPFDPSLDINIGIGDLPVVWGNPDLIRRVFINLVSNAVKYNDKSPIVVNIGSGELIERSIGNFVEVFVEDNGKGIPEIELKDIFSLFARGSSAVDTDGAGIGLAVVQRIVELHMGQIAVGSKVGQGTRFVLTLPIQPIELLK